jgi:hypothetical protein
LRCVFGVESRVKDDEFAAQFPFAATGLRLKSRDLQVRSPKLRQQ